MKKLKVIMIDAFKPSYLEHTSYLKSLTEKYQYGELDMGIGHWNGVEALFNGKSEIISLFYKNNRGSLKFIRYFLWLEIFGRIGRILAEALINFPRLTKGYELVKTRNIPLNILYKFDISVRRHFAKKNNIEFKYLGELDKIGHKYGTKSLEIIKAIKKTDRKISKMNWDFIFSDHGMADVEKTINVPITKDCFIDSDMARYWGDEKELKIIKEKLPLGYGKIINWNKKYGDLIFLADTGILIYPNFWNEKQIKAMHGYDGKHKDMKAFYIIKKEGNGKDLKAEELHEELKNFMNNKTN